MPFGHGTRKHLASAAGNAIITLIEVPLFGMKEPAKIKCLLASSSETTKILKLVCVTGWS
jgi:hypothetical protein